MMLRRSPRRKPLEGAGKTLISLTAAGGLLLWSGATLAQTGPQLIVSGPEGAIPFDSSVNITARVKGATGVPLYQFWLNHRLVRGYSRNNRLALNGLADGNYRLVVHSLGIGQIRRGEWNQARTAVLTFHVGLPTLELKGPADGIAPHGHAFLRARVVNAFGYPYYAFWVNGRLAHPYAHKNWLTLRNLSPGTYTVIVRSLGPRQYRDHAFWAARTETYKFAVPSAHATVASLAKLKLTSVRPIVADQKSTEDLAITALDASGGPVANVPVTVVSSNPAVVSVSPSVVKTDASGVAVVTLTAGQLPGTATISAINGSVTASTAISTTPVSTAPTLQPIAVSGSTSGTGTAQSPAETLVGHAFSLSSTFRSRTGAPKSDVELTYVVAPVSGSLNGIEASSGGTKLSGTPVGHGDEAYVVPTDAHGRAVLDLTDTAAGSVTVSISAPYTDVSAPQAVHLVWKSG